MSNEDNVSNIFETTNTKGRKNNKIIIPIILFIILLLLLGFSGLYFYLSNRPNKIVTNMINTIYDKYETAYKSENKININETPIELTGDLKINTNIPGLEDLSKEQINYQLGVDSENKKLFGGLSLSEDNKKIIEAIYYMINNKAYLKLDEYEKLILIENIEDNLTTEPKESINVNAEDTYYLITELKEILIDSVDMKAFKKSTDTIKINDKDTKVNKLTYELNEENMKTLDENLSKNMLKNEELLNKLSEITDTNVEDIKSELEETVEEYEDYGKFVIYTKGINNELTMIEYINKETTIQIYFDNDEINKLSIKSGIYGVDFNIKTYTDEKLDIDYIINYGMTITGDIKATSKKINDDKYEETLDFTINYLDYNLELTTNYNIETKDNLFEIDTNNVINANELDQNTISEIMQNIMIKLQNSNLSKILEGLSQEEINPAI